MLNYLRSLSINKYSYSQYICGQLIDDFASSFGIDVSRAGGIEIESKRLGACLHARQSIFEICYATDLNVNHTRPWRKEERVFFHYSPVRLFSHSPFFNCLRSASAIFRPAFGLASTIRQPKKLYSRE